MLGPILGGLLIGSGLLGRSLYEDWRVRREGDWLAQLMGSAPAAGRGLPGQPTQPSIPGSPGEPGAQMPGLMGEPGYEVSEAGPDNGAVGWTGGRMVGREFIPNPGGGVRVSASDTSVPGRAGTPGAESEAWGGTPGAVGREWAGAREGGSAGSGLLADPLDVRRQLSFAASLMGNPVFSKTGSALLTTLMNQQTAQAGESGRQDRAIAAGDARFASEMQMRAEDSRRAFGQWMTVEDRLERQFELDKQKYGTEFAYRKMVDDRAAAMEQAKIDMAARALKYRESGQGVTLGSAPSGGAIVMTPRGPMVTYLPGSKEFKEATTAIDDMALMQNNVARLNAMVDKWGTTATGEVAGQAKLLHSQMLGYLGRLGNAGVLNEGEVTRYSEALPDPSQWSSKQYSTARISAAYQELYRLIGEKIQAAKAQVGPWGVVGTVGANSQSAFYGGRASGDAGKLPPGFVPMPSGELPRVGKGGRKARPIVPLGEVDQPALQGESLLY